MLFQERLMDLLGHEVSITGRADSSVKEIAAGILKEVGPDYLILSTTKHEEGGQGETAVDWWFRSAEVIAVVHATDCPTCLAPD